jgi:precorrin-2 dehydrogenase/sirohydrochlorin ferrochelatase
MLPCSISAREPSFPAGDPMPLFPLFADLSGREVLVVGGGEVATH